MPNGTPPIQPTQPKPAGTPQATPARPIFRMPQQQQQAVPGRGRTAPVGGVFTRQPADILAGKKPATSRWRSTTNLISVVLIILTLLGYGLMYFLNQSRSSSIAKANNQIQEIVSGLKKVENQRLAAEALAAQLDNEQSLLKSHVAWSALLTKLSELTPRKVNFTEFAADVNGKITVAGFAQTMTDLAKLTQSLNNSADFGEVEVSGAEMTAIQRAGGGMVAVFSFRASFTFAPQVLKTSSSN